MAGILQTSTISVYNTSESHSHLCIIAILYVAYQPQLCALKLLPKEFTGGFLSNLTILINGQPLFYPFAQREEVVLRMEYIYILVIGRISAIRLCEQYQFWGIMMS